MTGILILVLAVCGCGFYQFQKNIKFKGSARITDSALANEESKQSVNRTAKTNDYLYRDYGDIKYFNQDPRSKQPLANDSPANSATNIQKKLTSAFQALDEAINPEAEVVDADNMTTNQRSQNSTQQKRTPWSFKGSSPSPNNAPLMNNAPMMNSGPAPNSTPDMQNKSATPPTPPNVGNRP